MMVSAVVALGLVVSPTFVRGQEEPATEPEATAAAPPGLETDEHKVDYGLGIQMGRSLLDQGIEVDVDVVVQGLRDALAGRKPAIGEHELRRVMKAFYAETRRTRIRNQTLAADENLKAGEVFLAENKSKNGVVTLPSGLQYKVLKEGGGPKPTDTDRVEVDYRGTLIDGTEFDSSSRNDEPATFVVKSSLPGWRQALLLMPVGSRWELYVPPRLAYGRRGTGLGVGPEATVIFEMELRAIK